MIKTDLQKASWGATGWHVGLLPDQESLTGHHLLWNRIVGRQSASPAAHAQRCHVYIRHISLMPAQIHVYTSKNSLRDFWQRCSWSSILTSAILMPALVLRERTLLSPWISDIMDLRHTKISFIRYRPSKTDMEDNIENMWHIETMKKSLGCDVKWKINTAPKIFIHQFEAGLLPR